jgi:hypothetical protein
MLNMSNAIAARITADMATPMRNKTLWIGRSLFAYFHREIGNRMTKRKSPKYVA